MNFLLSICFFFLSIFFVLPFWCYGITCKDGHAFWNGTTKMAHGPCGHQQYCSQAVCANKPEWTGSEWFKVWQCYETDNSEKCSKEMQKALKGEFAKATCLCMFGEKGKDNTTDDLKFPLEIKQKDVSSNRFALLNSPTERTKETPEGIITEKTKETPEGIITEKTKETPEGIITERTKETPEGIITERTKETPEGIITENTKATPRGILTFGRQNFTSSLSIRHTLSTLYAVLMHFGNFHALFVGWTLLFD